MEFFDTLSRVGKMTIDDIINEMGVLGMHTTGDTKEALFAPATHNELTIYGADHFMNLIVGSPPGTKVSVEDLEPWCQIKLGDKGLAFVVARSIYLKGTRIHRGEAKGVDLVGLKKRIRDNIEKFLDEEIKFNIKNKLLNAVGD
jgi:hypothetical protein